MNNHKEQKAIALILKLRESGKSYRAIARTLNELEVLPRKIGSKWHHWVVAEIVKQNKKQWPILSREGRSGA